MPYEQGGGEMKRLLYVIFIVGALSACSDSSVPVWQWSKPEPRLQAEGAGRFQMIAGPLGLPVVIDTKEGYVWRSFTNEKGELGGLTQIPFDGKYKSALEAVQSDDQSDIREDDNEDDEKTSSQRPGQPGAGTRPIDTGKKGEGTNRAS